MTKGPDFFIVGAPKCGTTSLHSYLSEHPEIFMATKEQHFFGSDLGGFWPQPSADKYFASFAGSESYKRKGEASGWYLRSRLAADEIHAYNPDARIIAMIRNPLDMLPSLHSQYIYDGIEDLHDFGAALDAERDRRQGLRIPANNGPDPWRLFYRDVPRFHDQINRYYSVFGKEQVHVIVFDDLAGNPGETYRTVLEFLDVDPTFVPLFRVINANKAFRSYRLAQTVSEISDPSSRIRRIGKRLIPVHPLRTAILKHVVPAIADMNTFVRVRPSPPSPIRRLLADTFAHDIDALSDLLECDLSHWYDPARHEVPHL